MVRPFSCAWDSRLTKRRSFVLSSGIIWPIDTYIGFRRIGFGRAFSLLATILVNTSMSFPTWPSWWPRLGFPIYVERMNRTKHGSDARVFDSEGRFSNARYEEIFSKFATAKDDDGQPALCRADISDMVRRLSEHDDLRSIRGPPSALNPATVTHQHRCERFQRHRDRAL